MPPYFSINVTFQYDKLSSNFVKSIYNVLFSNGFPFLKGYYESEKKTLEEIISWNQQKLEKRFKLGFTQNSIHDYYQILLSNRYFSHVRVFWLYSKDEIDLIFIVPEDDIILNCEDYLNDKLKILFNLATKLWETGLPVMIQSCWEGDISPSYKDVLNGKTLCLHPFGILSNEGLNKLQINQIPDYIIREELNGAIIVEKATSNFL